MPYPVLTPEKFLTPEALHRQIRQFIYDEVMSYKDVTDRQWILRKLNTSAVHVCGKLDQQLVDYWKKEAKRLLNELWPVSGTSNKRGSPIQPLLRVAPRQIELAF